MRSLPAILTAAIADALAIARCGEPIAVPGAAAVDAAQVLTDLGMAVITATCAEVESKASDSLEEIDASAPAPAGFP